MTCQEMSPCSSKEIWTIRAFFSLQNIKATSKNVIPAKAGIQRLLTLLDSRLRGSDESEINRGSLKAYF